MPFFFVFVGVLLIITGVKDTYVALGNQLVKDFSGQQNFFTWVLAFGSVGALGYVDKLRPFTNMFMVLILLAMVLSNSNRGDILTMVSDGLNNPVTPARPTDNAASETTQPRVTMFGELPKQLKEGKSILDSFGTILNMFGSSK